MNIVEIVYVRYASPPLSLYSGAAMGDMAFINHNLAEAVEPLTITNPLLFSDLSLYVEVCYRRRKGQG